MLKKLNPHMYVEDIYKIDYDKLILDGIKGIIFDIDNTLIPYEEVLPRKETIKLIEELKRKHLQITLVSNNSKKRVDGFNADLNLYVLHRSWKPLIYNLVKARKSMNLKKEEIAIIGDQIFTDVLAGNRMGIKTILVKPIRPKNNIIEKTKRWIEDKLEDKLLQKFNKKA